MGIVRVLETWPKRPIVKEGKQACYLLLHLYVPSDIFPPPSPKHLKGLSASKKAGKQLGVHIWPICVTSNRGMRAYRYLFRFQRYKRDDDQALRIGEAILYAAAITDGPLVSFREAISVFRVPAQLVREKDSVPLEKLIRVEESRNFSDRITQNPYDTLGNVASSSHIETVWKIAPLIFHDEQIRRSVRFLKSSDESFHVYPGEIAEVLDNPHEAAITGYDQNRIENALQDAFKAVEAVIGDPPKDDRKLFAKIGSIGLDPNELVGYSNKTPLHQVIRDMNGARDKKAAHGSTSDRKITTLEMMEYQACANYIVWAAIESKMGHTIF
jgi:hypothetical protein